MPGVAAAEVATRFAIRLATSEPRHWRTVARRRRPCAEDQAAHGEALARPVRARDHDRAVDTSACAAAIGLRRAPAGRALGRAACDAPQRSRRRARAPLAVQRMAGQLRAACRARGASPSWPRRRARRHALDAVQLDGRRLTRACIGRGATTSLHAGPMRRPSAAPAVTACAGADIASAVPRDAADAARGRGGRDRATARRGAGRSMAASSLTPELSASASADHNTDIRPQVLRTLSVSGGFRMRHGRLALTSLALALAPAPAATAAAAPHGRRARHRARRAQGHASSPAGRSRPTRPSSCRSPTSPATRSSPEAPATRPRTAPTPHRRRSRASDDCPHNHYADARGRHRRASRPGGTPDRPPARLPLGREEGALRADPLPGRRGLHALPRQQRVGLRALLGPGPAHDLRLSTARASASRKDGRRATRASAQPDSPAATRPGRRPGRQRRARLHGLGRGPGRRPPARRCPRASRTLQAMRVTDPTAPPARPLRLRDEGAPDGREAGVRRHQRLRRLRARRERRPVRVLASPATTTTATRAKGIYCDADGNVVRNAGRAAGDRPAPPARHARRSPRRATASATTAAG